MIGDIRKFKFWCQKVLPLVYDDSLSYYEVLCKVVNYLNNVIADVNSIPEYIDGVIDEKLSDEHLQELIEQSVLNIESAISNNNEGDNTNSSADYNIGQMLWWNGKLYRVIRQIDAGDTFIVDTNIALVNFEDLFNDFVDEVKHDITANDDGGSPTATQSWTAGTWLWLNDVLYIVKSDITEGNAYVFSGDNANVEQITVEGEINKEATARNNADNALQSAIDNEANARELADENLQTAIGNEATARNDADTALQTAINNEATARNDADTALQTAIDNEATARNDADTALQTAIDDEATARNDADEALQSAIDNLTPNEYSNVIFIFDSLGENITPNISTLIPEHMRLNSDNYISLVQGGCGFTDACPYQYLDVLQNASTQILNKFGNADKITQIIVQGGSNDAGYDYNIANIRTAIDTFANYCNTTYPNAKIKLLFTGWTHTDTNGFVPSRNTLIAFDEITRYGGAVIDCTPARHIRSFFVDLAHPTADGQEELAKYATNILLGGISDAHYEIIETLTAPTGITYGGTGTPKIRERLDNNQVSCNWVIDDLYYIQFNGATSDASGNCTNYLIGTVTDWIIGDNQTGNTKFTVSMGVGGFPEGVRVCPVTFTIAGGNIYAAVMSLDTTAGIHTLNFSSTQIGVFDIYSC